MIKELTNHNFKQETETDHPVIAEFYSPTCVHCKRLEAALTELAEEFKEKASFVKCDITAEPSLASRYDITAVPTLLFISNGQIKERLTGSIHKLIIAENIKKL